MELKVLGGNLAGASDMWTSFGGEAVLSPDVAENGKNAAEVVFRLQVPTGAGPGIHGVRVATPEGVSPLHLMMVDDIPGVTHQGSNTSPESAQQLTLPVGVDGVVQALQRNYYRFHAEAGQRVTIEVFARRLGSPLDPMLRLFDSAGHELGYSDDEAGMRGDARINHTFAEAGEYIVEVRDIRYQGGAGHFFRLRIGAFPAIDVPYPMAVTRGVETRISFAGPGTDEVPPQTLSLPADTQPGWLDIGVAGPSGGGSSFVTLAISDIPEVLEHEPNQAAENAQRVEIGSGLNGRIETVDDVDLYVFSAKKGQVIDITGITRRQGAPTSLDLRLLGPDGKQLALVRDFGVTDAVIQHKIPADGDYTLAVRELHRHAGAAYAYRVVLEAAEPGFELTASEHTLNVPAGGTVAVTVSAQRTQFGGPIGVRAVGLPAGFTSVPSIIGSGQNSVVLTITAEDGAAAGKVLPVVVEGVAQIGEREVRATAAVSESQKAALGGLPWTPQTLDRSVAVALAPQPAIHLRAEPAAIVFGPHLKSSVKVTVQRREGYDEEIALAVTPEKNGLPEGITAAVKPIPKGQNEVLIEFTATDKAAMGEFTAVLSGTVKKDKETVTQTVPGIGLGLQPVVRVKVNSNEVMLARGGQVKLAAAVERNPAFSGAVAITVENLPAGVTAGPATAAEGQTEVAIVLSAAADAAVGEVGNLTVKGEAAIGEAKVHGTSPAISLKVTE